MQVSRLLGGSLFVAMNSALIAAEPEAPRAKRVPNQITAPHGHTRTDRFESVDVVIVDRKDVFDRPA